MKYFTFILILIVANFSCAHEVSSLYPNIGLENNGEELVIQGRWEHVSGPKDLVVYPREHSFRIVCYFKNQECIEAIARIYHPDENVGFTEIKLIPAIRKFRLVQNDDTGLKAVLEGRAGEFFLVINNSDRTVCMHEEQIIDNKDGSRPLPSKWCLNLEVNK